MSTRVEQIIVEHVRSVRRSMMWGGVVLFVITQLVWLLPDAHIEGQLFTTALGLLIGGFLVFLGLRDPAKHPVLAILRTRPGDIVWAYVRRVRGRNAHSDVVLGMIDGKTVQVEAKPGSEDELLQALATVATHATIGFDASYEATFAQNPAALRRA